MCDQQSFTLTEDGAWCFFADPRAVYYEGDYKRDYISWINKNGDIKVGYFDHDSGEMASTIIKNELEVDDHANPSLIMLEDERLVVFYSAHSGPKMFYRMALYSEDITNWSKEYELPVNTKGKRGYTYPTPLKLEKEDKYYLFWRGGNFKPSFATSTDLIKWSEAKTLIKGKGERPYIRYVSNGINEIHFAFTDGHPNREDNNNIYYGLYKDGSFYNADKNKINELEALPLKPEETDLVYNAAKNNAKAWVWDIAIDNQGYPVIVYATFPKDNCHIYHYACWNGSEWTNQKITESGSWFPETPENVVETEPYYSGGLVLDHKDPGIVYLSRSINDVFEIEKWSTRDKGKSWESKQITVNSDENNVRPYIIRNQARDIRSLLWMKGKYIHYTDYKTELKMELIK